MTCKIIHDILVIIVTLPLKVKYTRQRCKSFPPSVRCLSVLQGDKQMVVALDVLTWVYGVGFDYQVRLKFSSVAFLQVSGGKNPLCLIKYTCQPFFNCSTYTGKVIVICLFVMDLYSRASFLSNETMIYAYKPHGWGAVPDSFWVGYFRLLVLVV